MKRVLSLYAVYMALFVFMATVSCADFLDVLPSECGMVSDLEFAYMEAKEDTRYDDLRTNRWVILIFSGIIMGIWLRFAWIEGC